MKRRYLALLLAASTAVSQIFGTASIALASELVTETEAVYTDTEEIGEILPEEQILDAEIPEEGQMDPTVEDLTEDGQANAYDVAELNLEPELSILSIEPSTEPEGLASDEEAQPQNEGADNNLGLQISFNYGNGTPCMTPGSSQILSVEAWVQAYDPNDNFYYNADCAGIGLECTVENGAPITVTLVPDSDRWENNQVHADYEIQVSPNAELGEKTITVKAYLTDASGNKVTDGWEEEQTVKVYITDNYTNVETTPINQMLVGETKNVHAVYNQYTYANGGTTSNPVRNTRYRWEWNPDQMEISYMEKASKEGGTENRIVLSQENPSVTADTGVDFQLKRLTNDNAIKVMLYVETMTEDQQNWDRVGQQQYLFWEINYIDNLKSVDEGDISQSFKDRLFNCETVTQTVEAMEQVKDDKHWAVNWTVGIYDAANETYSKTLSLEGEAYSVSKDTKQITLDGQKIQEQLQLQDNAWFNIKAEVVAEIGTDENGAPITAYADEVNRNICLCEVSQELQDLPGKNQDVMKGWNAGLMKENSVWIRNPEFPDGQNCPVLITGVSVSNTAEEGETSITCDLMQMDDREEYYQFEAVDYGESAVTVKYKIVTSRGENDGPSYSDEYSYDYKINVCENRFTLNLTSDRDRNGYTNLRKDETVTLRASIYEEYESEDTTRPTKTIEWIEDPAKVTLKPSEDGQSCEVTAIADGDTEAKVTAVLKVTPENGFPVERARESWSINICDSYFRIDLGDETNDSNYSYSLEHGESITVTPKLQGVNMETPNNVEWYWDGWDLDKLEIKDAYNQVLGRESNTGTAPFTLTKQGSESTNICLKAYIDGESYAVALLWLNFEGQNYNIWYENLNDYGFYMDDPNPRIQLDVENLIDKDQYKIEWQLGNFDDEDNPIEMENTNLITYYTLDAVTVSEETKIEAAAVNLNLQEIQNWLTEKNLDSFTVQTSILSKDSKCCLGKTSCTNIWLNDVVNEYDFGFGLNEDGVMIGKTDESYTIWPEFMLYIENAANPYGAEEYLPINDVELKVEDGYSKNAVTLEYFEAKDEQESDCWELNLMEPCKAELSVTYTDSDGEQAKKIIPIEVIGEGYYFENSQRELLMYQEETQKISADLIYWNYEQNNSKNPSDVTIEWKIEDQWPTDNNATEVIQIEQDESNPYTIDITAMANGEAVIVPEAYKGGELLTAGDGILVKVSDYKIVVDGENGAAKQYIDREIDPPVALNLKLQQNDAGSGKDYEGQVRYIWKTSGGEIELKCSDENVAIEPIEADDDEEEEYTAVYSVSTTQTIPESAQSNEIPISVAWIDSEEDRTGVKVIAEIREDEDAEWQTASSWEWEFQEYSREIWLSNARGERDTWIFTNEENYTLSLETDEGLLENGRYLEWTIGITDGENLYSYPAKEGAEGVQNESISTAAGKKENYKTGKDFLTILSGSNLNQWITEQKAAWQKQNPDQDPEEALDVFIEAAVMLDKTTEESNDKMSIELCSIRCRLEMRDPEEYWTVSRFSPILLGRKLCYNVDTEENCIWINKYVEDSEHPYGATLSYPLVNLRSSDPDIVEIQKDGDKQNIIPTGVGTATLTYTYRDGDEQKTFDVEVKVIDSSYKVYTFLQGNTSHMQPGETKQICLTVKQLNSVWNASNQSWEVRYTDLTEDQYSVRYIDRSEGQLQVSEDGKVKVLAASDGSEIVDIEVTIPQNGAEPYKMMAFVEIMLEDSWYELDMELDYTAAPTAPITLSPKLGYYENGELKKYVNVEKWGLYPAFIDEWDTDTMTYVLDSANGTMTISSANKTETVGYFYLTADYYDRYSSRASEEMNIRVSFCEHSWTEADGWQTVYWSTCSEKGLKEKWCRKCEWVMDTAEIPMREHSWNEGVVTSEPTCQKEGERELTCTACAATTTKTISKTAHQPGSWTLQNGATCTAGGTEVQKCIYAGCGEIIESRTTGAKPHEPGSWQTETAATCTAGGTEIQKCKTCGTPLNSRTTEATGHLWSDYTTTKQPTGAEAGLEVRTCQKCQYSESRAIAKLPATIKLTEKKLTLQLNKSAVIKSIVTGLTDGDAIARWSSSNPKVVTVNQSGKITGKKVGNATITVTLKSGISASITVDVQKKAVATKKITVADTSIKLTKGSKLTLKPVRTPVTTLDKMTYTTSNKKVAVVNSKGQITAKAAGNATITVKSGKKSVKIKVTVETVKPTKITGIPKEKTLKVGKGLTLKPKFSPKGSEAAIQYSTSNKKVATVSSKGKITAKKKGKAVITIKAGKAKATCTITVK